MASKAWLHGYCSLSTQAATFRLGFPASQAESAWQPRFLIVDIFIFVSVTCGVGVDFAFYGHQLGFYVLDNENFEICCWSLTLATRSGWRRVLFYLPIACLLAWESYELWLAFFDAGLLVILSMIHCALNILNIQFVGQAQQASNSMSESLLHPPLSCYNQFDEILVSEKKGRADLRRLARPEEDTKMKNIDEKQVPQAVTSLRESVGSSNATVPTDSKECYKLYNPF
ncbi:uncharacterized protein LOC111643606 [Copidosoma floridanum]|uniref:uncharacterized protein LOC111643606 n=1 Tax=Copidosoma floridanum TaxID=29053 RepID=UPI000C6F7D6B|nr:uncharacterized protein LOC111643606 [Copidosoma floridanum]